MAVGKRMTKSPSRSPCAAGTAGLAFAAVMAVTFPLLADAPVAPTAAEPAVPPTAAEAEAPAATPAQRRATEAPSETGRDDASDVEAERRFNDLRRELLDHRMKLVDWWLMVMAIFLTLLGVGAVIAGYLGFKRFREIEAEARGNVDTAREHAEEARKLVAEIKKRRDEADSLMTKGITAETAAAKPDKADEAVRSVQADPAASPIDRAVSAAIRFQRQGNNEEAIEKWRAVASVADGTDDELGAQAWFSVGYLHGKESRHQEAIASYDEAIRLKPGIEEAYYNRGIAKRQLGRHEDAIADYDEAIRLKPDNTEAYNNRGVAKDDLGRYEDAIADYDKAIQLKRDYVEAYNNRGVAKEDLGQHEEAIADLDEAIRLKPDYAKAYYNRANVRFALGHKDEARQDFERAFALARAAGDETVADKVSREIERLFGGGDP